jgi:hypothetical protein
MRERERRFTYNVHKVVKIVESIKRESEIT